MINKANHLLKDLFIIAEMSGNHNQSLGRALAIVKMAAKAGVNALKIQTYTADTMTIDVNSPEFTINDPKSMWHGKNLYSLYQEASTPWEWHKPIFDLCKEQGIVGFSTPFDEKAVDFLESLAVPMYKIASFEIVDIPLIKRVAQTKKLMIISVGMATENEIREAVGCAQSNGCPQVVLLKCTSSYPADPKDSNLLTISDMAKKFKCKIGLSDHTLGVGTALASIGVGAVVIEKHFTLSRSEGGVDSAFSLEPPEMQLLVEEANNAYHALGKVQYGPSKGDKKSLALRRSLYAVEDIKKGEIITKENVRSIRPGFGLAPKHYADLLGKMVNQDITKGTAVEWMMIKP